MNSRYLNLVVAVGAPLFGAAASSVNAGEVPAAVALLAYLKSDAAKKVMRAYGCEF